MLCGVSITVASLMVLLWAEKRQARLWIWLAKPTASAGYLVASIASGAAQSQYGRLLVAGQLLGWFGDVLLIPDAKLPFLLGIASFLLGHVAYAAAFIGLQQDLRMATGLLAGLALVAIPVHRWIMPRVPEGLRWPVRAYVAIISLMVAAAAGCLHALHGQKIIMGAILFYLSDLCVARQKFVHEDYTNKLIGLPLYYVAQLLFAASVML